MTHRGSTLPYLRGACTGAVAVLALSATRARADEASGALPFTAADRATPRLEERVLRPSHWTVGLVLERGVHAIVGSALADDQLFGVSGTYFFGGGPFGITSRLMVSPNFRNIVNTRAVALGGVRLRQTIFGVETFLGATIHAEARLRNHYWLTYVAPFEVGATVFRVRSFRVQVFTGLRAVVAGDLIDNFLIDPNGVNNDSANELLRAEKRRPWEGFLSIVVGRAM